MAFIEVKINGLEKLSALSKDFPVVAEKRIGIAIRRSLERLYREIGFEAPKDTGHMARTWTRVLGRFQGTLKAGTNYAVYVHEGTRPHFPPTEALKDWSRRHGIPAFLVARKISQKGTKANPFVTRALKNARAGIASEFSKALDDIVDTVTK